MLFNLIISNNSFLTYEQVPLSLEFLRLTCLLFVNIHGRAQTTTCISFVILSYWRIWGGGADRP